eukprot:GDKK01017470.1.p1 GENE.GDKK01017470.1~~GDKK01017470.1.p1  ORF type:complete len:240 (+),score=35.54 GDKK01017470.1:2-721(+)
MASSLSNRGVFLLDDGPTLIVWVGSDVNPTWLSRVLGVTQIDDIITQFQHKNKFNGSNMNNRNLQLEVWSFLKKVPRATLWRSLINQVALSSNRNAKDGWANVRGAVWSVLRRHIVDATSNAHITQLHEHYLSIAENAQATHPPYHVLSQAPRVFEGVILEGDNEESTLLFQRLVEDATSGFESFDVFFERARSGVEGESTAVVVLDKQPEGNRAMGKLGGAPSTRLSGANVMKPSKFG